MGVKQKFGNIVLNDVNNSAERAYTTQDRDGIIADVKNVQQLNANNSYYFTTGQKIATPQNGNIELGSSDATIIVKAINKGGTAPATGRLLARLSGTNAEIAIYQKPSSNTLQIGNYAGQVDSVFSVPDTIPFTVAIKRYNSNKAQMFLNGIAGTADQTLSFDTIANTICQISTLTSSFGWVGNIYRVLAFNYALTAERIQLYSDGAGLVFDDLGGSMVPLVAGAALTAGKRYRILARDTLDFTTMGAANNTVGTEFISTGTGTLGGTDSVLRLGAIVAFEPQNINDAQWIDSSLNGVHGTVSGALAQKFTPICVSRNFIINGAFDFWQRKTSATLNSGSTGYLAPDRFSFFATGSAAGTVAQDTGGPWGTAITANRYCLKITSSSTAGTSDIGRFAQTIESVVDALAGKYFTVSFWVKSSLAGYYPLVLRNTALTRTMGKLYHIATANTWTYISVTFRMDDVANIATYWADNLMQVFWSLHGSGSTSTHFIEDVWNTSNKFTHPNQVNFFGTNAATFYVSDVMMCEGQVSNIFTRAGKSFGGELALCQRYYEKSFEMDTTVPSSTSTGSYLFKFGAASTGALGGTVPYKVVKYRTPTLAIYDVNSNGSSGAPRVDRSGSNKVATITYNALSNFVINCADSTSSDYIQFHFEANAEL